MKKEKKTVERIVSSRIAIKMLSFAIVAITIVMMIEYRSVYIPQIYQLGINILRAIAADSLLFAGVEIFLKAFVVLAIILLMLFCNEEKEKQQG